MPMRRICGEVPGGESILNTLYEKRIAEKNDGADSLTRP